MRQRGSRGRQAQRGIALLAMLAVFVLGATYFMLRALNSQANFAAVQSVRNAERLNQAKQALIGHVARQAAAAGENNPGRLPCPEAAGYVGTANEGVAAGNCTLPAVGRLPWRTLGLDKLTDADGEPLWYAVSSGWALPTAGSLLTINSNTLGQLTLDGQANAAIALIIAPGAPMNVQAAAGCTARIQSRTAVPPDLRDYLECDNATFAPDASFVTGGAAASFNDQVLAVTTADLLPALEAAIAHRIEREIVPVLKAVYEAPNWGLTGSRRLFPYAAPWGNPGTSTFQGAAGTLQGLLPFNQTQGCNPATDPRCTTTLLVFSKASSDVQTAGSGSIKAQSSCAWASGVYVCTGQYWQPSISVRVSIKVSKVAMGLRAFDLSKVSFTAMDNCNCGGIGTQTIPFTATTTLNTDGSATITVAGGMLPDIVSSGWMTYANYVVSIDPAAMGDHALLDATDPITGWFVRNEWYRLLYYAAADRGTASWLPNVGCTTGSNCLRLTTWPNPAVAWDKRALLIVAGRSLANAARPNATLTDFVEFGNNDGGTLYEQQPISTVLDAALKAPFNDHVLVLDSN